MMSKSVSRGEAELQGDSPMNQAWKLLFQALNDLTKAFEFFNFYFKRFLVDILSFQFSSIFILPHFTLLHKLNFISFGDISGYVAKLCIFSNLVWWTSTDRFSINIDIRLLAHIQPDYWPILWVLVPTNFVQSCFKTCNSRLSTAINFEARNSAEVRASREWVRQLLDIFKPISHTGCISHVPHDCWCELSLVDGFENIQKLPDPLP